MNAQDFWSRRKAAVAEEAVAEVADTEARAAAQTEADLAERSDEVLLAELELPAPEALENAEAVREFLGSAVPQRLKTRALRQLWKLNPMLANLDGLVDYGEDFTDSATVIENLRTAYQVGKGMLSHIEAMAAKAEAEAAAEAAPPAMDEEEPVELDVVEAPEPVPAIAAAPDPTPAAASSEEAPAEVATTRRRMQFRFEEPA